MKQTALLSEVLPSLIQGISQQSIQSRARSSAEDQVNCLNSVLDGVVSRFGSTVLGATVTKFTKPFIHEIKRSETEYYIVIIEGGVLEIYNLYDGTKAAITGDIAAYLASSAQGFLAYDVATVDDNTFIVNRDTVVAMASTKSPVRANNAIAHFRAGNYKTTYKLTVTVSGVDFTISYITPDNSVGANAAFITTNQLAIQFELDITNTLIPNLTAAGHTGFSVSRYGSVVVIDGASNSFTIATEDGTGGKAFISFTNSVRKFSDLPEGAVDGYEVKVAGDSKEVDDDYYLKFSGDTNDGVWTETVAPDTFTALDPATMPQRLINTGLNTFTVGSAPWGARVAGDGILNALNPGFVGRKILDLNYIAGRLALTTEATSTLSKAKNAFVYFPDTVQTVLSSAPIDFEISNGKVTIASRTIVASEKLQIWADKVQIILDSSNDKLQEDTVDPKPTTNFGFDGNVAPIAIGAKGLVFATSSNNHVIVREVFLRNSRPEGQIKLNAHCPRLIPGRARVLNADGEFGMLSVIPDASTKSLYVYQWFNQNDERIQSAWNPWTFNAPASVVWVTVDEGVMYLMVEWQDNCTLERIELDNVGPEAGVSFPLRLDHRVVSDGTGWDPVTGKHTVTLPFKVDPASQSSFSAYATNDIDDQYRRGLKLDIAFTANDTVEVSTGVAAGLFSIGVVPVAMTQPSEFILKTDKGVIYAERLLVAKAYIGYDKTSSFRVDVIYNDRTESTEFSPRILGDTKYTNMDIPRISGFLSVPIKETSDKFYIQLINDKPFISQWQSLEYAYRITKRERM